MANENRYYKIPFGESGNKAEVPDVSVGGAVGYDTGFGPDYELPKGSVNRKRIERDMYNGVKYGITKNLKQWQENLYPTWIEDNGDGVPFSYPVGMVVNLAGVNYISLEADNQEEPGIGDKWEAKAALNPTAEMSGINFDTLKDLIDGTASGGRNIDYSELLGGPSSSKVVKVSTLMNNTTSKSGAADYLLKTLIQAGLDGDVIDGAGGVGGNHACADGVNCVVLTVKSNKVSAEAFGCIGDGVTDDYEALVLAKNSKNIVILDHRKTYGIGTDLELKSNEKIRGNSVPFLGTGATIKWLGVAAETGMAMVWAASSGSINIESRLSTSYAELSNVILDGSDAANRGFYGNFIGSGTLLENIFVRFTNQCAWHVTKAFYCRINNITARSNNGAGVTFGKHPIFAPYVGDHAVNALGTVFVEGHSNGKDLLFDPLGTVAEQSTGYGLWLGGTLHTMIFQCTLEANQGPCLIEAVSNGEFRVNAYGESSSKIGGGSGDYSVWLRGTQGGANTDKCIIDLDLRANQKVNFDTSTSNARFYTLLLEGSDSGTGLIDNGFTNYQLDPRSRSSLLTASQDVTLYEDILYAEVADLDITTDFNFRVYGRDNDTFFVRIIPFAPTGVLANYEYQVFKDGVSVVTKSVDVSNKSSYELIDSTAAKTGGGLIRIAGSSPVGTPTSALIQVYKLRHLNYSRR